MKSQHLAPTVCSFRAAALALFGLPLFVACGGGGGGGGSDGGGDVVVVPIVVNSATATSTTLGQEVVLTLNGTGLDQAITVNSTGCTGITRSSTAPRVSTATVAYYTCTASAANLQQFNITRNSDGGSLATATYTVTQQLAVVSTASVDTAMLGQEVLLTLNGTGLDQALTVTSAGCTGIARSTTAPRISTATAAYYTCTATALGSQQFNVVRNSDGATLSTPSYTVVPVAAVVSNASVGATLYNQQAVLTLEGTGLDGAITVSSPGCTGITRSTTAPRVSTATLAYYTCTVAAVGLQQFNITRISDNGSLAAAPYTVAVPQVTMNISNGAAVTGSYVITLSPTQAPVTVRNFLNYVNAGFYTGTVFHRYSPGFVLQGGGYAATLTPGTTTAVPKATNAAIVLEDNTGLSNTTWTVAMARTGVADSATSQFFINLTDNLFLNRSGSVRGYAVFGTITTGTNFVTTMTTAPCSASPGLVGTGECLPSPNLVITSAVQTQ